MILISEAVSTIFSKPRGISVICLVRHAISCQWRTESVEFSDARHAILRLGQDEREDDLLSIAYRFVRLRHVAPFLREPHAKFPWLGEAGCALDCPEYIRYDRASNETRCSWPNW